MPRDKGNYQESPSGGQRHDNVFVQDANKDANSGLTNAGFMRFVHKFNRNGVMDSPTTSSGRYRGMDQQVKINKGIAGKIK